MPRHSQPTAEGGAQKTCSCDSTVYAPTFIYGHKQVRIFFCGNCGRYLSNYQTDRYDGSQAFHDRVAEIEEQVERRKKQGNGGIVYRVNKNWQEDIYDQVV